MPRKLRPGKRRRDNAVIRPCVEHYLLTGEIVLAPTDNPWTAVSLLAPEARAARRAWQDGDETGAGALLSQCPAGSRLFLED